MNNKGGGRTGGSCEWSVSRGDQQSRAAQALSWRGEKAVLERRRCAPGGMSAHRRDVYTQEHTESHSMTDAQERERSLALWKQQSPEGRRKAHVSNTKLWSRTRVQYARLREQQAEERRRGYGPGTQPYGGPYESCVLWIRGPGGSWQRRLRGSGVCAVTKDDESQPEEEEADSRCVRASDRWQLFDGPSGVNEAQQGPLRRTEIAKDGMDLPETFLNKRTTEEQSQPGVVCPSVPAGFSLTSQQISEWEEELREKEEEKVKEAEHGDDKEREKEEEGGKDEKKKDEKDAELDYAVQVVCASTPEFCKGRENIHLPAIDLFEDEYSPGTWYCAACWEEDEGEKGEKERDEGEKGEKEQMEGAVSSPMKKNCRRGGTPEERTPKKGRVGSTSSNHGISHLPVVTESESEEVAVGSAEQESPPLSASTELVAPLWW